MKKRLLALLLVLATIVTTFVGCRGTIPADSEYKGQQFIMHMTENIYNLDPAEAYKNDSARSVASLLFDTLFNLNTNGKVKPGLAKKYRIEETKDGEYFMYIEIKEDARWSDNQPVTADDVVYAWKRILNPNNSYECASMLFEIKNARAYNEGEMSKDDLGLSADGTLLTIQFEGKIDYDQFLLNLTSLALAPLREDIASKNPDWAKKPGIMTSSGPFKLSKIGFYDETVTDENGVVKNVTYTDVNYAVKVVDDSNKVVLDKNGNPVYRVESSAKEFEGQQVHSYVLERNLYYFRNAEKEEKLDKTVIPYRIIVDFSMTDEELLQAYNDGVVVYIDDIPLSIRSKVKEDAETYAALSTTTLYLNQNAYIADGSETGTQLFANKTVRQALSMAIDRNKIAETLVFAQAATGLVPTGVYDTNNKKKMFRDESSNNFKYLKKNVSEAASMLAAAGINPSDYTFTITVPSYDEEFTYMAEQVVEAWGTDGLGFNVSIKVRGTIANNDHHKDVASVPTDLCDDLWAEDIDKGDFEVAILDLVAPSADPFSVLAPFAKAFSGQKMDMSDANNYELTPHITGYDSEEYNALIEKIYKQKNIKDRSGDLHKAESILMEDLPVIPLVFNDAAYLFNSKLVKVKNKFLFWDKPTEYYYPVLFSRMKVRNKKYEAYEDTCAKFISENYSKWQQRPNSYIASMFSEISLEEFKKTNSYYLYLYKEYEKGSQKKKDKN